MFPTPRKGDGAMDSNTAATPSNDPRQRGRRANEQLLTPMTPMAAAANALATPSPSPARRRGCNCKKSGCLKLYCECFAAGMRCGDRCQCLGCKNREHNKLEIAHAMETIERRSQRSSTSSFKSPVPTPARKRGPQRPQPRGFDYSIHGGNTPTPSHTQGLRTPVIDGATRLLMSAEQLDERAASASAVECVCAPGACLATCPCHVHFGGCGNRCACHHTPTPQEKPQEKTRGCSCKKSNCLKLYCECLAAQRQCDSRCNCEGCKNDSHHAHERERAITSILERNPMAFEPKVATGAAQHQRGCNCRKSNCMKNYCECHQAGVPCTGRCACQDCRNTDAFVSAKKMLIFSGDLKVRASATNSPESHAHAVTPGSAKPPRRPIRRVSLDQTSPPSRRSTAQPPSALELLSRTAPPASQQDAFSFMGANHRMQIHAKRKQGDVTLGDEQSLDATADGKRKFTKSTTLRLNFQERLDQAASASSPIHQHLPSVDSVLDADFNAADPELPLSKLCRSLLHAAASVDVSPTPRKKTGRVPSSSLPVETGRATAVNKQQQEQREQLDGGAVSPMTDDLLCEEDIEAPTRGSSSISTVTPTRVLHSNREEEASSNGGASRSADAEDRHRADELRLAALQERAVLQEFSVWLRNLASSSATPLPH